ncbi:MAG: circularly permuted type 2 ATP-grasp protein [Chloroflexi bacterium]|nr:circularly permuted type 2 ATP-grasp protein [Chloroflexota bacterium]
MLTTREAVEVYHGLLNDQLVADSFGKFNRSLRARRLYFGERPLCTVLRPQFYSKELWAYIVHETETVLKAFWKAHAACMTNADLRAQLDLEPYEEELFSLDIGYEAPWSTARLDSFFTIENNQPSLRFVEYNAETPAGMSYADELASAFMELEPIKQFQQHYHIHSMPVQQDLLAALLEAWRQWGGTTTPQIGIIDWQDLPTHNEHQICRDYFMAHGCKTILADPHELEYRNGHLWVNDFRVDFIYKRVLCSELIEKMGLDNTIVRALKDRAVCMSNAFSAKLMAKKASFAVMSDEQNHYLFTSEEITAIDAHIPWTRRVSERKTYFHEQAIDLVPFIADNRDKLVLKPNDEYGGSGVVLGWEADSETWNATIQKALYTPFVVQERVSIGQGEYPYLEDDKLAIRQRMVDSDPYIFHGRRVNGCLTRISSQSLLNVTAGGGSVIPTFIIEKKN